MKKVAYIAIDVHARECVIGWMDSDGIYQNQWRVKTSESRLIQAVVSVEAKRKIVTIEEASLALWVARTLRPYVDELIVCDPRENDLISKNGHKSDGVDTLTLSAHTAGRAQACLSPGGGLPRDLQGSRTRVYQATQRAARLEVEDQGQISTMGRPPD